jgi:hypothetical protein
MRFSDLFLALFIVLAFYLCYFVSFAIDGYNNIKKNWSQYRCNPMIMPFAGYFGQDTEKNFAQCVSKMQKATMPIHIAPLSAGQSVLHQNVSSLSDQMGSFRELQSKLRPNIAGNFSNTFGIFNSVLVEMQKFTISFRDMIMKLLGTMTVLMHLLQGQQKLGESIVKGPVVGALKKISGKK